MLSHPLDHLVRLSRTQPILHVKTVWCTNLKSKYLALYPKT
jgi:hypothetical protein